MTFTASAIHRLFEPFAPTDIHWRAQGVTKDGAKAMALAYIDARNVMERLDEVCGAQNWEDSYHETDKGRLLCTIRINVDGVWIAKSDGAGESDIEGEKGAISGAFKRAAVKWGIGRYLYDMPCPWVECESYEADDRGRKKFKWSAWKPEGLRKLDEIASRAGGPTINDTQRDIIATLAQATNVPLLRITDANGIKDLRELPAAKYDAVIKKLGLSLKPATQPERQAA